VRTSWPASSRIGVTFEANPLSERGFVVSIT
jgi:hypothetical protein